MPGSASLWLILALYVGQSNAEPETGCLGSSWTCQVPRTCANPQKELKDGSQVLRTCTLGPDWLGVCCNTTAAVCTKSKEKCEEYAKSVYDTDYDPVSETFVVRDMCRASEPLIVNGQKAAPQEFPHMALIGGWLYGRRTWFCGGSLISEQFVLSAAHCMKDKDGYLMARWVRLGEYNVKSTEDDAAGQAQPMDFEIVEWYSHPGYDVKSIFKGVNDIALFKLNTSVVFNEFIRPICLSSQEAVNLTNRNVLVTGWGITEKELPELLSGLSNRSVTIEVTDFLRKANVTLLDCRYEDDVRISSVVCAADLPNQRDTCLFDSGGPLQVRLAKPYCMYLEHAVTSHGPRHCGTWLGRYMKVSYFLPWIESIVWP